MVKYPKFARFYHLPRFTNVCILFLADPLFQIVDSIQKKVSHHLQPIAQRANSFIKDTNHFLGKIKSWDQLPEEAILCNIDIVGLYPKIPHEECLASLRKFLDARTEKKLTNETSVELAEIVLKSNIFQFNEKTLKLLRGTAIGTRFVPPYAMVLMADLEEGILEDIELQPGI